MISTYSGDISLTDFENHNNNFNPFKIRNFESSKIVDDFVNCLIIELQNAHEVVDVSYIECDKFEFYGDSTKRRVINMPLSSYASLFVGNNSNSKLSSIRNVWKLYLAQMPLFSLSDGELDSNGFIKRIASILPLPSFLHSNQDKLPSNWKDQQLQDRGDCTPIELSQVNLWMNIDDQVSSSLHYDDNHNILCCYKGIFVVDTCV